MTFRIQLFSSFAYKFIIELIDESGSSRPSRNPSECTILGSWVSENFIFADGSFAKSLWILETCALHNNNLWGNLVSSLELPTTLDVI